MSGLQTADRENTANLAAVGEQAQAQPAAAPGAAAATTAATQTGSASELTGALGPLDEAASSAASPLQQVASAGAGPVRQVASSATAPLQQLTSSTTSGAGSPAGPSASREPVQHSSASAQIQPVSDGWDDPPEPWKIAPGMDQDEFGHFHTPAVPIVPGEAGPGSPGAGAAPV